MGRRLTGDFQEKKHVLEEEVVKGNAREGRERVEAEEGKKLIERDAARKRWTKYFAKCRPAKIGKGIDTVCPEHKLKNEVVVFERENYDVIEFGNSYRLRTEYGEEV